MERESPCCVWDGTSFENVENEEEWIEWLEEIAKKWTFQREETKEGKPHLQLRLSLKTKARSGWWVGVCPWLGVHWSRTSAENRDNMFYVMKPDTRIAGPWSDTDEKVFIQERTIKIEKAGLHPWQIKVLDKMKVPEERTINCVVKEGNLGASSFIAMCDQRGLATLIDCWSDMTAKDVMQLVMEKFRAKRDLKVLMFDIPRRMGKLGERLAGFWEAIETIKNGRAYDPRYGNRGAVWFEIPNVWIFMNDDPDLSLQSTDRWRLWTIRPRDLTLKGK